MFTMAHCSQTGKILNLWKALENSTKLCKHWKVHEWRFILIYRFYLCSFMCFIVEIDFLRSCCWLQIPDFSKILRLLWEVVCANGYIARSLQFSGVWQFWQFWGNFDWNLDFPGKILRLMILILNLRNDQRKYLEGILLLPINSFFLYNFYIITPFYIQMIKIPHKIANSFLFSLCSKMKIILPLVLWIVLLFNSVSTTSHYI